MTSEILDYIFPNSLFGRLNEGEGRREESGLGLRLGFTGTPAILNDQGKVFILEDLHPSRSPGPPSSY